MSDEKLNLPQLKLLIELAQAAGEGTQLPVGGIEEIRVGLLPEMDVLVDKGYASLGSDGLWRITLAGAWVLMAVRDAT